MSTNFYFVEVLAQLGILVAWTAGICLSGLAIGWAVRAIWRHCKRGEPF